MALSTSDSSHLAASRASPALPSIPVSSLAILRNLDVAFVYVVDERPAANRRVPDEEEARVFGMDRSTVAPWAIERKSSRSLWSTWAYASVNRTTRPMLGRIASPP